MQLNKKQLESVFYTEGPLLIIAGAGSGKTRVLIERLAHIIETGKARPEEILTVTFTNKAALEIKERVTKRLSLPNMPWIGTFHSIAVKILRKSAKYVGIENDFVIFDTDDQLAIIKRLLKQRNLDTKNNNPKAILSTISSAKNEMQSPKDFALLANGYFYEMVADLYTDYQKQLRLNNALDFDDLLLYLAQFLDTENSRYYKNQFKYVMVDEYQDTNKVQYEIVRKIVQINNNICVVGDDDQSIYSWRGATIRNIFEFEKDFESAKVVKLEQNYRSTQNIINAGNSIVEKLAQRKPKLLWTENSEGEKIQIYNAIDERDESEWVSEKIESQLESDETTQIGVLYRMNAQSRLIEEALLRYGISYRIVGNVRFYDRKEVKDILAYLRIVYNKYDNVSILRVINVPARKIGPKSMKDIASNSEKMQLSIWEYLIGQKIFLSPAVLNFVRIIEDLDKFANDNSLQSLIKYTLERTGYNIFLSEKTEENQQRQDNLLELINVASKYVEMSPEMSLQLFLEEVALIEAQSESKGNTNARVTLMTVHSAKGLEFDSVYVLGLEEGIFPHSRTNQSPQDLDEERRLAYVAVTRARKLLQLVYTSSRTIFGSRSGSIPSRFLADIPVELVEHAAAESSMMHERRYQNIPKFSRSETPMFAVEKGDLVTHQLFGRGKVIKIDSEYIIVDFQKHGKKEMATEYAILTKI